MEVKKCARTSSIFNLQDKTVLKRCYMSFFCLIKRYHLRGKNYKLSIDTDTSAVVTSVAAIWRHFLFNWSTYQIHHVFIVDRTNARTLEVTDQVTWWQLTIPHTVFHLGRPPYVGCFRRTVTVCMGHEYIRYFNKKVLKAIKLPIGQQSGINL